MLSVLIALASARVPARDGDPFSFLAPSIDFTEEARGALDGGETIIRMLPGRGSAVDVLGAVAVRASGKTLAAQMRRIEELKESPYVDAVARFSEPPRMEDLEALEFDEGDLENLRRCRPGSCGLKLSESEMERIQDAMSFGRKAPWNQVKRIAHGGGNSSRERNRIARNGRKCNE